MKTLVLITALSVPASVALAGDVATRTLTTYTESFELGANEGGWTFGTGNEYLLPDGGNPGAYLRDDSLVTFTPRASTSFGVDSPFTGEWSASGVTSLGIDLATISADRPVTGLKLSIVILNDNGTPFDLSDDWGAFLVTDRDVPPVGVIGLAAASDLLEWRSYDFEIPASSNPWPDGWRWISRNGTVRDRGSWGRLMRQVSHVGFQYGDPSLLYPLASWQLAMDNPRITRVTIP